MNILITTSSFHKIEIPGYEIIMNPYMRKLNEEEMLQLVVKYDPVGIIAGVEPLTRKVLETASSLKIISRCGVGLDSVDMEAAEELGIKVTITPVAPMASVSELTCGMILCLLRKINILDREIRKGAWKGAKGNLLSGKTVGIVGCGRIGTYTARIMKTFGCNLLGYDPFLKEHDLCRLVSLEQLLKESDIVTLHIPYTEENHHMIGAKELAMMKKSAILVNAARGGLVDEAALYDVLKNNQSMGAAIDCFETEPYQGPLVGLENVLLMPHMGSSASEARLAMEEEAFENLRAGLVSRK